MRENYEELAPSQWTAAEAMHHITGTFDRACKGWPEIMEPFIPSVVDAVDDKSRLEALRHALRETITKRL